MNKSGEKMKRKRKVSESPSKAKTNKKTPVMQAQPSATVKSKSNNNHVDLVNLDDDDDFENFPTPYCKKVKVVEQSAPKKTKFEDVISGSNGKPTSRLNVQNPGGESESSKHAAEGMDTNVDDFVQNPESRVDCQKIGSSGNITNGGVISTTSSGPSGSSSSTSMFKVPEPPRPKLSKATSSSTPSSKSTDSDLSVSSNTGIRIGNSKAQAKKKLTEKRSNSDRLATMMRRTCVFAFVERLEDNSDVDAEDIEKLVSTFNRFPNIFSSKRFPRLRNENDLSSTDEIAEFAQWWFFGLTALFLKSPYEVIKPYVSDLKHLIRTLCQRLERGYPHLMENFTPRLLKLLRDLTFLHNGCLESNTITISLTSYLLTPQEDMERSGEHDTERQVEPKEHVFNIKIINSNEWTIFHFIEAVSIIFPRIYYSQHQYRHVFFELLQRLLWRISPASVDLVKRSFMNCLMPNLWYLTEEKVSSLIREILESPTTPTIDPDMVRKMICQYEVMKVNFQNFSLKDCGLTLPDMGVCEFLYSEKFNKSLKNSNDVELAYQTFTPLLQQMRTGIPEDIVKLTKLISEMGLDVVLHPVLSHVLIHELKSNVLTNEIAENSQLVNLSTASSVWSTVLECWENELNMEKNPTHPTSTMEGIIAVPGANSKFLESTMNVAKLATRIKQDLKAEGVHIKLNFFKEKNIQSWTEIVIRRLEETERLDLHWRSKHQQFAANLETIECLDTCSFFSSDTPQPSKILSNLFPIPGLCWLETFRSQLDPNQNDIPEFFLSNSHLQVIANSPVITSKCVRVLRLDSFRPWKRFVLSVYSKLMASSSIFDNQSLVNELLLAIADISWVMKELSLKTIFCFLIELIQSKSWIGDSFIRTSLGNAILSLPCICCYNSSRSNSNTSSKSLCSTKSGCEICHEKEASPALVSLSDDYANKIVMLASPILKSKFLLVKFTLSDLIIRCNNHQQKLSSAVVVPMVGMALRGKKSLCQDVFRKIGNILLENDSKKLETVCPYRTDVAQKIFTIAMPSFAASLKEKQKGKKSKKERLPLVTRTKFLQGILALSSVGSMPLSVFIEIVKFLLCILADSILEESVILVMCRKIISEFADKHQCRPQELICRIRHDIAQQFVQIALKLLGTRTSHVLLSLGEGETLRVQAFIVQLKCIGSFQIHSNFVTYYYPSLLQQILPKLHENKSYQLLLTAMAHQYEKSEKYEKSESEKITSMLQDQIMHYLPMLLLDYGMETAKQCLTFLKKTYNFDAIFLARQEQRVLNEALARLDDRQEQVQRYLKHFCKLAEDDPLSQVSSQVRLSQDSSKMLTRSEIQELLDKRALPFIIHVESRMNSKYETIEFKQRTLRSFTRFIRLLGKSKMIEFRSKVYKTLISVGEQDCGFHEELFESWKEYANTLDDTNFALMSSQILVALLRLREIPSLLARVDGLISHFVCFKKTLTKPHHAELYFILDHCDDVSVRNTITETVVALKTQNWVDYFNMLLKEAKHDNYYIRYQAFRKLRDVFKFDFELVDKHVLSKGEHLVSDVLTTLLGGLRLGGTSEDDKIRLLIVDCFGLLGALDSSRFRKGTDEICSRKVNMISCQIRDFCVRYLQELCREFQEAKDTTTFDYCACLIRIVLQVMNVKDSEDDELWSFLTNSQRVLILPILVREDYGRLKTDPDDKLPKLQCPIYLSSHGKTFEDWLTNWITVLITCITREQQQAYQIFSKSLKIIRKSIRISSFVAPYVATYAIFCVKRDQRKLIIDEIKTVLERWTILEERKAMNSAPIRDTETEIGLTDTEEMSVEMESVFHSRCTQVILTILEHLIRFHEFAKRRWGLKNASGSRTPSQSLSPPMSMENMETIEKVLDEIPNMLISQVAFDYQSYTTALFYFERELKCSQKRPKHSQDKVLQKNLDYLQRIYVSLNNLDDVIGISAVRDGNPSSHEHVLECLAKGEVDNSIRIIERMSANQRKNFTVYDALVQAYLSVEEPHKAETVIKATLQENPEWEVALQEEQFSTLLQLQKWDELKTQVDQIENLNGNSAMEEKISCWKIDIPRILSKLKQNEFNKAIDVVENMKLKIISPLVAASEEIYPYKRAYNYVVQLHILTEIEDAIKLLRKGMQANCSQKSLFQDVKRLVAKWEARIMNVCTSRKILDQIMNVRKSVFEILKSSFSTNQDICDLLNSSIRECWLGMARDASKCGSFTLADNCLIKAKEFMSPKVLIEEAKILSRKGNKVKAISVLNQAIGENFPESLRQEWKSQKIQKSGEFEQDRILCAKALLLQVKLNEDLRQLNRDEYRAKYKEPIDIHKESEKNYFTQGCYYGRLWNSVENKETCIDLQAAIVHSYSQSLLYGCKYVYQSLPELLSIWFDCSAKLNNLSTHELATLSSSTNKSTPAELMQNMNQSITRLLKGVPVYILMTAFSQLISRLCHPNSSTWDLLKQIIVRIVVNHPYQALWKTVAVYKSVNGTRQRRCKEIYDSVRKSNPELKDTIKDYTDLSEKLLCLCEKMFPKETTKAKISEVSRDLPNVIKKLKKVLLPFQLYMNPTLPRKGFNHIDSDPFPETQIFIEGVEENVDIMTSLQKPKKITLRATDGKLYSLLCKREDDLRKDSKVMEVNSVVNWYLKQNPESTQRRLYVRTYSVIPLNETCGLLEWVPNLIPYRIVLHALYREMGLQKLHADFRREIEFEMPLEMKKALFEKHLAHTPPVFGKWFFNTFTDHQSWYAARLSYTRTTAVMSMVGYIMGLGDRHGENILLDTVTGEVVHVDFNCLFSRGEEFQVPERVPFRLTHNMVDAMGPLGVEGTFRKSCEVVMKMFRDHQSIFMSVLRPFVYDPFVEWDKDKHRNQNNRRNFNSNYRADSLATLESGERMNAKAVETMVYIQHRLDGTARTMRNVYDSELSVEAFVQYLINEATSVDNLCQMYYGWIPSY